MTDKKDKRVDIGLATASAVVAGTALTGVHAAAPPTALGLAVVRLMRSVGNARERRVVKMWEHVVSGQDDPEAFTRKVEDALLEDGNDIAHAVMVGAQAAADSIALSAVASIGLLARLHLQTGAPLRREYRAMLDVLRHVDDVEFGALRTVVHKLAVTDQATFRTTVQRDTAFENQWSWFCTSTNPAIPLLLGDTALVLVRALEPLATSSQELVGLDERARIFDRRVMQTLAAVMPL